MNLTRTMTELGDLYEEKVTLPSGTFEVAGKSTQKKKKASPFVTKNSGPENADGFKKEVVDPETAKSDNFFEPKKFSQNNEKMEVEPINNFMNKSIFDELFENVMSDSLSDTDVQDSEALGLPSGDEASSEGSGDEVTLTLDRETAQKLHDLLSAVIGGESEGEGEGEGEGESEPEAEGSEDAEHEADDEDEDEDTVDEATELTALPDSKGASLQSKNNKVHGAATSLVTKGKADGKIKDQQDGEGSPLADSKGKSLEGKNNKVASGTSKVGAYLAGLKK